MVLSEQLSPNQLKLSDEEEASVWEWLKQNQKFPVRMSVWYAIRETYNPDKDFLFAAAEMLNIHKNLMQTGLLEHQQYMRPRTERVSVESIDHFVYFVHTFLLISTSEKPYVGNHYIPPLTFESPQS